MKKYLSLIVLLLAAPAAAEDNQALQNRIERMQRDLNLMQKEVYRGETDAADGESAPIVSEVDSEQEAEKQRALNGKLEELEHHIQKVQQDLEKYKKDTDLRLKDLETAKASSPAEQSQSSETTVPKSEEQTVAAPSQPTFATAQEHYSYAFKQLNAAKFDVARQSLESFIETYPKDQLIGNAHYWLGEIHYVKRDYVKAADSFRVGYEKMPEGPKAPDNLYKLAMSLSAQDKSKEACIIFGQLKSKFPKLPDNLKQNLESERKRNSCK